MLSMLPLYAPMLVPPDVPMPIAPTNIETFSINYLLVETAPTHLPTNHSIETIAIQYLQSDVEPPIPESTSFAVETVFIQYLERI